MLNLWLAGLVCCACIAVGWLERRRYLRRMQIALDLVSLVAFTEEQIRYNMASLPCIFERYAALHPRSAVGAACRTYPTIADLALPRGEWEDVKSLLSSLGQSDLLGQEGRLEYVRARFETMRQNAESDYAQKGTLHAKLWSVLGVGLLIWMV